MAEKEMEETTSSNGEAWGTLEELLLACAVNRHGTACWDSIANELQKRITPSFVFSPHICKQKYVDLKRRFSSAADGGAAEERENDDELLRMVDELRKLRVEQLRREVQRHDLSIVSLQLKVKRLEEERENTSPRIEEPEGGSDLRIEPDGNTTRTGEKAGEPERSWPEKFDLAENQSFHSSNSASHDKADNKNSSPEKERESKSKQRKPEVHVEPDPVEPVKESGSGASRPAELGESVSQSKRESGKQSSDVQSSASLSKSKKKPRCFRGGGSSGDELQAEEVSPANKRISVKSQPLIRFLEILRSHKHGSVFQRRLPSQETEKYRNVIRQHVDLDMVESRLDKGAYNDCHPKFYRDLLLIFTNAVIFYRKSSAEHLAARELRKLVTNEIITTQTTRKSDKIRLDIETNHPEPVVKKPRSSTTNMVVCRRRSSSSMQALSESMKNKNGGKVENGRKEEEPTVDRGSSTRRKKEREGENENEKPAARERSTLRSGGLRLSNNNNRKIISKEVANKREKVVATDQKPESNSNKGASVLKKKGVANFLKRMKQNSPSSQDKGKNDDSEQEDEQEEREDKERREKEESNAKKGGNLKRNTRNVDVVVSRRNPSRRGEKEAPTARRAGGRPPKRKAAVISSTPEPRKGGRSSGRDGDKKSKKKPRR